MQEKFFTMQELADRWDVDITTIRNWRNQGIITQCKGVPAIRFLPQYIAELEGVKLEPFSPLLKKKMEREIEELKEENSRLKQTLNSMISEGLKVINY